MSKKFYPEGAAVTKDDVFERIDDRIQTASPSCYGKLGELDETLLTDEMMQEYVNKDYDAMFDNIEFGDDAVGRETEKVLFELAKVLTNSPDVEFNQNYGGEEEEEEDEE